MSDLDPKALDAALDAGELAFAAAYNKAPVGSGVSIAEEYGWQAAVKAGIEAYLSASMAGPVPEGWVTVPVELEGSMWVAARKVFETEADRYRLENTTAMAMAIADRAPEKIYAAILVAALRLHPPAPALPEAKPVASPAEGEAVAWMVVYPNGSRDVFLDQKKAENIARDFANDKPTPLYSSPDREAATREAVIEECAKICDAVRPRLSAGRSRRLNQMDEHVASVADSLASRIRALAQQAKPQQDRT